MRPPVEHVRVSTKGKDILIKIKRRTGIEHWNVLCRLALCRSLSNPTCPKIPDKDGDSSIDIDWKTFTGPLQNEIISLISIRAHKDGIDISKKDNFSEYFRAHLERGIANLNDISSITSIITS